MKGVRTLGHDTILGTVFDIASHGLSSVVQLDSYI